MKIITEKTDVGLIIRPEGRLDSITVSEFEKEVMLLIQQSTLNVLIDFEKLVYISSAGLRILIIIAKDLKKKEKKLALCALNETIKEVFHISELDTIISIFPTIEDGLISLGIK